MSSEPRPDVAVSLGLSALAWLPCHRLIASRFPTVGLYDQIATPNDLDVVFAIAMALVFMLWYKKEGTLSIHEINNDSREKFYWIIVLTTFALGTGVGDTVSEFLNVGYLYSLIIFGAIFILAGVLNHFKTISSVLAFWIAFIVTRPIGASLGDLLIQDPKDGGLGISIVVVNVIFFAVIIASVAYLTVRRSKERAT